MTQSNQIQKNDDFKLVIVFRIEGRNSRTFMVRIIGIATTVIAIGVKIAAMLVARAH